MRKKILAFVFAAALLIAMAVPLFGGAGTALAGNPNLAGRGNTPADAGAAMDLCDAGIAEGAAHSPDGVPDNCPE